MFLFIIDDKIKVAADFFYKYGTLNA